MYTIQEIRAHEILDSRGNPTVSVSLQFGNGHIAEASVPSGASTGRREAFELRDHDEKRYRGLGVLKAVHHVNSILGPHLRGMDVCDQVAVDRELIDFDGTPDKSRFGANAILGISLAVARAGARAAQLPLYRYLAQISEPGDSRLTPPEPRSFVMPVPMMNVLNGGVHADNTLDFQEFMIFPLGAPSFAEALRFGAETFHAMKKLLAKRGLSTAVGDEGGFAPDLESHKEALDLMVEAIELAGFKPGKDIAIALDPAVSGLFTDGVYHFHKSGQRSRTSAEMIQLFRDWTKWYPIVSIEDPMAEDDTAGWQDITRELGPALQLVGDDNFVSNPGLLRQGIRDGAANAVLVKVNQIGTLTEALETIRIARSAGYSAVISHRSGETEDSFIADLAVGTGVGQIKAGSACRSERIAKYNRLLAIEREIGRASVFGGQIRKQGLNPILS